MTTGDQQEYLRLGRRYAGNKAWADAFEALAGADRESPLSADDLDLLATCAYMAGEDAAYRETLDRAYHERLALGESRCAARCAFWLGLAYLFAGQGGRGAGWLANAEQLLVNEPRPCAEAGFLSVPLAEQLLGDKKHAEALEAATSALEIGEQCADADLVSCARHLQGRALIGQGDVEKGLQRLDQAMLPLIAGKLSPIMTGLIYCSVIEACHQVYALARAWEWTAALSDWCEGQPQMVAFTTTCLVHRAELMQLRGEWMEATKEAGRARARRPSGEAQAAHAAAHYRQAELDRLRGDNEAAEAAYVSASREGFDPQPGLALLRFSQGRRDAAVAALRRALGAAVDPLERARLLPAYTAISVAVDDLENAQLASRELADIAAHFDTEVLRAMAAHAAGTVMLAAGDASGALASLGEAFDLWQRAEAPYEAAQTRLLKGLACRECGDDEGATLELEAAKASFANLGAASDLVRVEGYLRGRADAANHSLTPRELQVLRLIASGKTNRAIAEDLNLSEKTVDRHASNIFNKIDVPSRAAATAFAFKHSLI